MNLVRKYKISKAINKPLPSSEQEIVDFIHEWLKDLIPFKRLNYPNTIHYMKKDGRYVLQTNNKVNFSWIRNKDFWEVLNKKYLLTAKDIQNLLKFMIEENFKQDIAIPHKSLSAYCDMIEEAYKQYNTIREIFN